MAWQVSVEIVGHVRARCHEVCGWTGTPTSDAADAERERDQHYRLHAAASDLDDDYVSPRHVCPFCLNERELGHQCTPWDGVDRTKIEGG